VLGVERSTSKEGIFNPEQAKGEFFTVLLRITNVGDDARSFSASSQHLIVNGNKYDASSSISDEHWMEDINPGLSIDGKVTFDIPPGATPEAIECHDSMFSGGTKVRL
jgi:archaellum component FlaG (FlaF/FlaG flagellin family)